MNILISGGSGMVGRALSSALEKAGHQVFKLIRSSSPKPREVEWDVETGGINAAKLRGGNGPDAVFHLAGESIAGWRWTENKKSRIRASRVQGTERLAQSLLKLPRPPSVFIGASAIGYYGDRGEEILTEESGAGEGFLTEVVIEWEKAAEALAEAGIRVAHARFGLILSGSGGALPRMVLPFRYGLGGRIGDGRQWLSWITLDDVIRALSFALEHTEWRGAFNATAPQPVRNAEWTRTVAEALRRPAMVPVPGWAVKLALGEMGEALMLSSQRVMPTRLLEAGFEFRYPDLAGALKAVL